MLGIGRALPHYATRVRLHPSVDPPVLQEVRALAEGLLAISTLIWLLSRGVTSDGG